MQKVMLQLEATRELSVTDIPELSDLYKCRIPIRLQTPGCAFKSMMMDFAPLEHAFMYRMIRFPIVVPQDDKSQDRSKITSEDAILLVQQFNATGVYGLGSKRAEAKLVAW